MEEFTRLLQRIERGDLQAGQEMLPLVYRELRRIAAQKLNNEKPGHTLQATALVHEAYLRMFGAETEPKWENRGHFFASAAEAMQRILVENARRKRRVKRGGHLERVDLDESALAIESGHEDLIALDEALGRLAVADADAAKLVQLRYFAGCSVAEAAECMRISVRTAGRLWAYAQAWLMKEMRTEAECDPD